MSAYSAGHNFTVVQKEITDLHAKRMRRRCIRAKTVRKNIKVLAREIPYAGHARCRPRFLSPPTAHAQRASGGGAYRLRPLLGVGQACPTGRTREDRERERERESEREREREIVIYVSVHVCKQINTYIYIYRERERERPGTLSRAAGIGMLYACDHSTLTGRETVNASFQYTGRRAAGPSARR